MSDDFLSDFSDEDFEVEINEEKGAVTSLENLQKWVNANNIALHSPPA